MMLILTNRSVPVKWVLVDIYGCRTIYWSMLYRSWDFTQPYTGGCISRPCCEVKVAEFHIGVELLLLLPYVGAVLWGFDHTMVLVAPDSQICYADVDSTTVVTIADCW
jgi:hypothetical protein